MSVNTPAAGKKYKTVLFDMDGVIVDSMEYHAESWQRIFKDYGISLSKNEILKREGMSGLSSIIDIIKEKGGAIPHENELKKLLQKKLELFEGFQVEIFPFVREMLSLLSSKNIQIGLVTGSMRRSVNHVLPKDLFQLFNVIITVDELDKGKPHPEPYLRAMEKLGSNTKNTLVIENAPLGIDSAKSAGLDCFALETTLPGPFLEKADKIFHNHNSLLEYLQKIINSS